MPRCVCGGAREVGPMDATVGEGWGGHRGGGRARGRVTRHVRRGPWMPPWVRGGVGGGRHRGEVGSWAGQHVRQSPSMMVATVVGAGGGGGRGRQATISTLTHPCSLTVRGSLNADDDDGGPPIHSFSLICGHQLLTAWSPSTLHPGSPARLPACPPACLRVACGTWL